MTKSLGRISSLKLPTAEKAIIVRTPILLSAAMFAREGTSEGVYSWWRPWREMKATGAPDGVSRIITGEDGEPQGVVIFKEATDLKPSRREMPVPPMMARETGES